MSVIPTVQVPGVYHRRFGDIVVTALCDGYLDADAAVLERISLAEIERILRETFRPLPCRLSVNAFLIHSAGRVALIETGSGNTMGPTLGHLTKNMRLAGTDPLEIDTVLLTHMHPDHSNGLLTDDGERIYANAEILIHHKEVEHWFDDGAMAMAPERKRVRYFQGARKQLTPYLGQYRPITDGEVFPGVTAVPIPGHTPGHTAYRIDGGGESVLIWGDTVHVPEIQTRNPDVVLGFDSDQDAAAAMRRRLLDMAATDGMLIAGMHTHFPGFAHVTRYGQGYDLIPEAWSTVL